MVWGPDIRFSVRTATETEIFPDFSRHQDVRKKGVERLSQAQHFETTSLMEGTHSTVICTYKLPTFIVLTCSTFDLDRCVLKCNKVMFRPYIILLPSNRELYKYQYHCHEMGTVRQNAVQRTVRTAHISVFMTVHNYSTQHSTEYFG